MVQLHLCLEEAVYQSQWLGKQGISQRSNQEVEGNVQYDATTTTMLHCEDIFRAIRSDENFFFFCQNVQYYGLFCVNLWRILIKSTSAPGCKEGEYICKPLCLSYIKHHV